MLTMFKRLASLIPTPATNKVTLFVSDTGIPSYKDDTGLVTPMSGQPIPAGYIDGLKMEWVSGTQIRFTSGSAYIPSLGRALALAAAVTKTPTLAASTWYHAYLYSNAGTPDVEVTTTSPDTPYSGTARTKTGDTSRRYIGSFRTDASGGIIRFNHNPGGNAVDYVADINLAALYVLANGSAATSTSVSMATAVPITSRQARLFSEQTGTSSTGIISNSDVAAGGVLAFARGGQLYAGVLVLNSSQEFTYFVSGTGQLNVWCAGYYYER
jgi:hypothetical protein